MKFNIYYILFILFLLFIIKNNLFFIEKFENNIIITNKVKNHINKVCIYLHEKQKNKKYKVLRNFLNKQECFDIINEGIDYAKKNKWSKKRHEHYPTTDNKLDYKWKVWKNIKRKVEKNIFPKLAKLYKLHVNNFGINEIFLIKYNYKDQKGLEYHEDGSEFSFIIKLNNDFSGGGTTFKYKNITPEMNEGDCLIFSGQNTHKGNNITSGTRYILAGFLNYGGVDYCENYIQLKNN